MTGLINPEIDTLLKDTSRSFFLTLEMLPKKIRGQVGLLYLLARVADTIADTKTGSADHLIKPLEAYDSVAQGTSNELPEMESIAALQEHDGERRLLSNVGGVISALEKYSEDDQKLIRKCLGIIIGGQTLDLQRFGPANESGSISALQHPDELDDYAYRVAGSVGEFWTSITLAHLLNVNQQKESRIYDHGVRFGKALQMINILRDIPEDLRFGRCYIPMDSLDAIGISPTNLLEAGNMEKFRPLYDQLLDVTSGHLDAAVEYVGMLPYSQFRLRGACMLPILIAQNTVNMLREQNVLDAENRVKVSRDEIKILIKKTKRSLLIPGASQKLLKTNRDA